MSPGSAARPRPAQLAPSGSQGSETTVTAARPCTAIVFDGMVCSVDEAGGEAAGSAIQAGAAAAVKAGDGTLLFLILCSGDYMRVFPGMPRAVPGIGIPRISCNSNERGFDLAEKKLIGMRDWMSLNF